MNNVIKRIDEVAASCDAIGFRQAEAESRTSALEDDMAPLQARVNELIKSNSELASQVLDLQARSRRDNLCVSDISIDRAHRTFGPAADDRPRPVIIKFHRSRDVTTVLSAAKRAGDLQYEDRPLRIVPDIPPRCNSSGEASPTSAWSSSREKSRNKPKRGGEGAAQKREKREEARRDTETKAKRDTSADRERQQRRGATRERRERRDDRSGDEREEKTQRERSRRKRQCERTPREKRRRADKNREADDSATDNEPRAEYRKTEKEPQSR
uniref:Uncharacterized protein n=1 Tax=Knipowitschia caucasica TaxID=637954 RepID=A0AAV2M350_KNICA